MNRNRALDQIKAATFIGKNAAFLGCLLCGLSFQWSKSIPTAGITPNNCFIWNPDWFDSLTFEERKFILLHELWHIALLHGIRCGDRDPKRWVAACDYRINANLVKDGYDTIVGEGGVTLSGGQRQRLAIARALLLKTEIILFDEATSALDNETQREIQESIRNMQGIYTILIIAHRLSTVVHSDRLILVDDGKIIGMGTHEELLKTNEMYKTLYHLELKK